ncbi:MAG TPA: hypothetical protein V6D00_14580, partial [Pantanalinema sp.]
MVPPENRIAWQAAIPQRNVSPGSKLPGQARHKNEKITKKAKSSGFSSPHGMVAQKSPRNKAFLYYLMKNKTLISEYNALTD